MTETLRTYKLRLETLAPVFIGSGRKINKKEYIFDEEEALIPDMRKMYEGLRTEGLAGQYEDYLLNDDEGDLRDWLGRNKISRKKYLPWIAYTLESGEGYFDNNRSREVVTFIKDAYGCPYVPGSSVKGMLRTVLTACEIMDHPEKYGGVKRQIQDQQAAEFQREKADRRYLQRENASLERIASRLLRRSEKAGDAVNDLFSAVRISDSRPLSTEDLVLCQKRDRQVNGEERNLPLVRECLKPGITIECDMIVDAGLLKENGIEPLSPEMILRAVKRFNGMYQQTFRGKFGNMPESDGEEDLRSVYLGGGCGFVSKTEIYPLFGDREGVKNAQEIFRRTLGKNYKKHKHDLDGKRKASPHVYKLTYYRGQTYEMGKCLLHVK